MRTLLAAVILVLVAGIAFVAGRQEKWSDSRSAPTPVAVAPSPAARPPAEASPQPAAARPQPTRRAAVLRAATRPSATTDEARAWQLIDETRKAAGDDTARQSELLRDRLEQLSPREIVRFARVRRQLDRRAYTWNLWAAASLIEDGCSDDCFRDFRSYLISLGRGPYERAFSNPDSLASVAQDPEAGDWENADDVAPDAYSSVTGGDFPLDDSDLSGAPRGTRFDDNRAALARRFPRLAARFR